MQGEGETEGDARVDAHELDGGGIDELTLGVRGDVVKTEQPVGGIGGEGIEEDVSRIDVFSGDHPEDVEVLGTVRQGQFNLHAVVVGIGEDAVLRKFVQAEGKVKQALTLLRRRQIYPNVLY